MSTSYPEGEVFFLRSALSHAKYKDRESSLDATHPRSFRESFLIEYIWNVEGYHGKKLADTGARVGHPRTEGYSIVKGSFWNTHYGNFNNLPVSYGRSEKDIRRRCLHNLCTDGNTFKQYQKKGAAESWFMAMPMPTSGQRWVWIDMVTNIRAIYIPIAHQSNERYPEFCTYVCVNFAGGAAGKKRIWSGGDASYELTTTSTFGIPIMPMYTMGFDIMGLTELLCIPRHFRKVDPYSGKFIKMVPRSSIKTVEVHSTHTHEDDFDWVAINKANTGLSLMWVKGSEPWLTNFFKNALTIGLGFIPLIGPILSVGFNLGWTAVINPESFMQQMRDQLPNVDLAIKVVEEIRESAARTRKLVRDDVGLGSTTVSVDVDELMEKLEVRSVEEVGPSAMFREAGEIFGNITTTTSSELDGNVVVGLGDDEGEGEDEKEGEGGIVAVYSWTEENEKAENEKAEKAEKARGEDKGSEAEITAGLPEIADDEEVKKAQGAEDI